MWAVICAFDTGAGSNLIQVDVLGSGWLDNGGQRDTPDIHCSSNINLKLSGTTSVYFRIDEASTGVNFCVVSKLVVLVLLETMHIDEFSKLIPQAERKTAP